MKVYFQKIKRWSIYGLCAVMFITSLAATQPMTVHAETVDATFDRLIDSILAQTGVSANYSYVSKVSSAVANILRGSAGTYEDYCMANNLTAGRDSWTAYLNSDAYYNQDNPAQEFWKDLFGTTWFLTHFFDVLILGSDYSNLSDDELVTTALTGEKKLKKGGRYVVPDEATEAIRATFDEIVVDELGYYYIDTYGPDNIVPSWFPNIDSYNNFVTYVKSSDFVTVAKFQTQDKCTWIDFNGSYSMLYMDDNTLEKYLVANDVTDNFDKYFYKTDWSPYYFASVTFRSDVVMDIASHDTYAAYEEKTAGYSQWSNNAIMGYGSTLSNQWTGMFTKDGRKVIVFKTLDSMKNYLGGCREVFSNVTYDYSTTNDNSVTIGGDYLLDESYESSYENIVNNIDNSSEDIDENTVNNIVGDTINNITNNYYIDNGTGDSGDGSGDSNNSGSDTNIWDGLTTLVGGIGDMLNFFVTLIGEVLSLLANMLTEIMNLIGEFKDVSGDFVYFMADFFVFIPEEFWNVILLGVTSLIGIAIWKAFQK